MLSKILQNAFIEMNVKEIPGKNHNPRILLYHNSTSLKASTDEVPWCSSFANYIVGKAGLEGTNSAMARSWEKWGKEISKPIPGCIVVFSRGSDKRFGHVAIFLYETKKNIYVIGGNQSDSVNIASYPKSKLVTYRSD
jgi:uncharacterized protein (TIGR02594 family)